MAPVPEPADKPKPLEQGEVPSKSRRHRHWGWPLGLAVAGLGGAAAFLLRGCWHSRMSWPTQVDGDEEFSYQVCTSCGIKRLYNEKAFHAYGPYGYDLHELIAYERTLRLQRRKRHEEALARREAAAVPKPPE